MTNDCKCVSFFRLASVARTLAVVTLLSPFCQAQGTRYYVDSDATPPGNGADWTTAYAELSDALVASLSPTFGYPVEIWVKEGTYTPKYLATIDPPPAGSGIRHFTFEIPADVHLWGGFDGTEQSLDDRAGLYASTILSGDVGDPAGGAFTIVTVGKVSAPTSPHRLDGFTITGGLASDINSAQPKETQGAGLHARWATDLTIRNCTFENCAAVDGGAIHMWRGKLTMSHAVVQSCYSVFNGGGMYLTGLTDDAELHSVMFSDCETSFLQDLAFGHGGAIYVGPPNSSTGNHRVRVFNGLFQGNEAMRGGAVYVQYSANDAAQGTTWVNCTFSRNKAKYLCSGGSGWSCQVEGEGRAFYFEFGGIGHQLKNSVVWGNAGSDTRKEDIFLEQAGITAKYCDLEEEPVLWPGTGNIFVDPRFQAPLLGNFQLKFDSPAIGVGRNLVVPDDLTDLDDDGNTTEKAPWSLIPEHPRIDGLTQTFIVDMGAHEYRYTYPQ